MSNYPDHRHELPARSTVGARDVATCGSCARSWCATCCPTPASLCPFCNGDGVRGQANAIPPRQAARVGAARFGPVNRR